MVSVSLYVTDTIRLPVFCFGILQAALLSWQVMKAALPSLFRSWPAHQSMLSKLSLFWRFSQLALSYKLFTNLSMPLCKRNASKTRGSCLAVVHD